MRPAERIELNAWQLWVHSMQSPASSTTRVSFLPVWYGVHFSCILCLPTGFLSEMWCYIGQGKAKMSNSSTFRPRKDKWISHSPTPQRGWEQKTTARASPVNNSRRKAVYRALHISAPSAWHCSGRRPMVLPSISGQVLERTVYLSILNWVDIYSYDCEQMINLL